MSLWPANVLMLPILNALAKTEMLGVSSWAFNVALGILFILWGVAGFVWRKSVGGLYRTNRCLTDDI